MLSNEDLSGVIDSQKGASLSQNPGIQRDGLNGVESFNSSGLFVLGVRGAGKSTYVRQLLSGRFPDPILLNMEDPRLSGFDTKDFSRLDSLLFGRANESLAFDEIQAIENWEAYIHLRQTESRNIVVAASTASIKHNGFSEGLTCATRQHGATKGGTDCHAYLPDDRHGGRVRDRELGRLVIAERPLLR